MTSLQREALHPAPLGWVATALVCILAVISAVFAGMQPFAVSLASVGAGTLCIFGGCWAISNGAAFAVPRRLVWPAVLFGVLLLWGLFQTLPFCPSGISVLDARQDAFGQAARQIAIAVDPFKARQALSWLCLYAVFFGAGLACGASRRACRRLVHGFLLLQALLGALALLVVFSPALGSVFQAYGDGRLSASFPSANDYAAFVGMGLCVCTACAMSPGQRYFGFVVCAVSLLALLIATGARGATACALIGVGVIIASALPVSLSKRRRATVIAAIVLSVLLIEAVSIALRGTPAETAKALAARWDLTELAWRLVLGEPWLGIGFGGFADVAPAYVDAAQVSTRMLPHAHNGYLAAVIALGIPCASAFFVLLASLAVMASKPACARRSSIISAACLGMSVQLFLLSWVNVPLGVPAITIAWLVFLGAGVSHALQGQPPRVAEPSLAGG
ncbi:MAG: O-antigen ligase family protein [Pseudomonadota bacterium]